MRHTIFASSITCLVLVGCGGAPEDSTAGRARSALDEASGVLAFVNAPETTLERLDVECAIRSDSAKQIIKHRDGKDKTPATSDDALFDSIADLDGVPMVGPWTLDRLEECAGRFGYLGAWRTLLEAPETNTEATVAPFDDGSAALLSRGIVIGTTGNQVVSRFRTWNGQSWSAPERIDGGYPTYASSYGTEVEMIFDHHLVRLPGSNPRLVAAISGRYSTSLMNADGMLYTLFARTWDGSAWGPWLRITPVGRVFNAAFDADASGHVWFGWESATNLEPGQVYLSSLDPTSGTLGSLEVVDDSLQQPGFQKVDVVADPDQGVWVTYQASDGVYARRRSASGTWEPRKLVGPIGAHVSAWSNGKLWVAIEHSQRISVHRLDGEQFVEEQTALYESWATETETEIESTYYTTPAIAPRPEGGIVVGVNRSYHYESSTSGEDDDQAAVVVRERDAAGTWSSETVAHAGHGWTNSGGALSASANSVWLAGGTYSTLFAARRGAANP